MSTFTHTQTSEQATQQFISGGKIGQAPDEETFKILHWFDDGWNERFEKLMIVFRLSCFVDECVKRCIPALLSLLLSRSNSKTCYASASLSIDFEHVFNQRAPNIENSWTRAFQFRAVKLIVRSRSC